MARNSRGTPSIMDRFADALANSAGTAHDGDVVVAGRKVGLDMRRANDAMQRLRKRLGLEQTR